VLPLTRNTTYTPASAVKSADLNDLQDAIIGGKHGLLTIPISVFELVNIGTGSAPVAFAHGIVGNISGDIVAAGQPITVARSLGFLPIGTRIVNVRVYLKDVAGQPALTVSLRGGNRAGTSAADAVTNNSAASGATQTVTLAAVNHDVGTSALAAAYLYLNTFVNATGTYSIYSIEIDVQKT
jgi:hypothetical protein